ncbi:general stress protein [Sediminibacillus albus]|uniref:Heat induced stress protein YflT n=1 Tax=Sediminibacillus albus TaxID=407036 RepID=A0A1G8X7B5_9BACI|nr:general stress protein [Sediminibacillus albus]SDJ86403.1 Heat induced stress protein YflT [Sediminibacillus albus]
MESKVIGGVFKKQEDAIKAIKDLQNKGYHKDDFSVFAKDSDDAEAIGDQTNTDITKDKSGRGKNAGKGLGIGAGTGGVLGGTAGLIAEIGLLAIPGVGAIAAAGPIAAALTGAGIGAGGGGIVGALVGAGIPEEHAKEYEQHLKNGNIIVLVEANENDREVYRTFLANKTENHTIYPDEVVVNEPRGHR